MQAGGRERAPPWDVFITRPSLEPVTKINCRIFKVSARRILSASSEKIHGERMRPSDGRIICIPSRAQVQTRCDFYAQALSPDMSGAIALIVFTKAYRGWDEEGEARKSSAGEGACEIEEGATPNLRRAEICFVKMQRCLCAGHSIRVPLETAGARHRATCTSLCFVERKV